MDGAREAAADRRVGRARRRSRSRRSPRRACARSCSKIGRASASPSVGRRHQVAPETLPSAAEAQRQCAAGLVAGELGGVALERLAAAVGLDAAAVRAVAGARRAVGVERHVAELGAQAVRAAEGLAVDHHAAARRRCPSVSITRWSLAEQSGPRRARRSWRRCPRTPGTPKRRPSSSRSGTPASGMFTLVSTVPVAYSICEGTPTPIASGWPAASITRAPHARSRRAAPPCCRDRGVLGRLRAVTPSTAATATFVPPTSTPRTTRGFLSPGTRSCKLRGLGCAPEGQHVPSRPGRPYDGGSESRRWPG